MTTGTNGKNRLAKQTAPMGELGVSGLVQFSGYINEEYLQDLQGDKAIRIFKEMWNSPLLGAAVRALGLFASQAEVTIEGEEDDPRKIFLDEAKDDMSTPFSSVILEAVTGEMVFGWSYHEAVYKRRQGQNARRPGLRSKYDDGKIGWRKFPTRSQDSRQRWEFDPEGGLQGMWQLAPPDYRLNFLPIEKSLLFRLEEHKNNPEGRSMLRTAYRAWYFAKRIEEIEGIGIERELAGLPIFHVPAEITTTDATAAQKAIYAYAKQAVRNIRRDAQQGIVLPQQYDEKGNPLYKIELLATGGERQISTSEVLKRLDMLQVLSLLAEFMLLGAQREGSYALAKTKKSLTTLAISAMLNSVANVFNRHAIPRLLEYNGMELTDHPKLKFGEVDAADALDLAQTIKTLADAGMPIFPSESMENFIRNEYRWPEIDEEERTAMMERQDAQADAELEALRSKANGGPGAPAKNTEPTDA